MKSKNKRGRPRTNRKPVLVRFDTEMIKNIDNWRKAFKVKSRPEAIRQLLNYVWPYQ